MLLPLLLMVLYAARAAAFDLYLVAFAFSGTDGAIDEKEEEEEDFADDELLDAGDVDERGVGGESRSGSGGVAAATSENGGGGGDDRTWVDALLSSELK